MLPTVSSLELERILETGHGTDIDDPVLLVEGRLPAGLRPRIGLFPHVLVGTDPDPLLDAVVDDEALAAIAERAVTRPRTLIATALLLRGVEGRDVTQSLVAESTAYSLLQSGEEFRAWRESRPRSTTPPHDAGDAIVARRDGGHLDIEFNRPERRNAYSGEMRGRLAEVLNVALVDDTVTSVTLRGRGTNFSSGGDLDEFGSFTDPVRANESRLASSVAWSLHTLRRRLGPNLVCRVHGANFGAGVELASFCGRVVAHIDTTFCLPEVDLGLVPGAGGTAGLPARVGRQRTALMAFTAMRVDARTAYEWGLVDEITTTS